MGINSNKRPDGAHLVAFNRSTNRNNCEITLFTKAELGSLCFLSSEEETDLPWSWLLCA